MSQATDFGKVLPDASNEPKIRTIFDFSAEALEQFAFWLEQRGLNVPITQILGFAGFTAKTTSNITASETTTSTTYADLTTVGPTLSGLADGQYLVIYTAFAKNSAATNLTVFSPSFNGGTPVDEDQGGMSGVEGGYSMAFTVKTLSNAGNNTIKLQYKVGAGTGTFINRRLAAFKFANA